MSALLLLSSRLNSQPQYSTPVDKSAPGAKDIAWLSHANTVVSGPNGYIRDVVSGRTATIQDSNNYLTRGYHASGVINTRFIGSSESALGYTGPVALLHGATEFTLSASFVFRSGANSGQWDNFYVANQHTLSVFSQTSSSVTFGVDWAGAWNGTSTQTVSNLNDSDVVMLLAVVNQAGARLFAAVNQNSRFLGTKSGSGFTVSSAANTVDIVRGVRGDLIQSGAIRRALPDAEALALLTKPWQRLKAPTEKLWITSSGGSSDTPVNPGVGSLTLTGYAPTVTRTANQSVLPSVCSLAISSYAPSVSQSSATTVSPTTGTLTITGYAPTIAQPQAVNPGVGGLTITGFPPTVIQNITTTVTPSVGFIALTKYAPTVTQTQNQFVSPATGTLSITGYAPSVSQPHAVSPSTKAITFTGYAPTIKQEVPPDPRYARPMWDMSVGAWVPSSGSSLAQVIGKIDPDSSYIYTDFTGPCEVKLGPVVDPGTSVNQAVSYELWTDNAAPMTMSLMQGAAVIATWLHETTPLVRTMFKQVLTPEQCDAITDYTDLRLKPEAL